MWSAYGMTPAISCCKSLGPWKASATVKVHYLDGEMPSQLMQERTADLDAAAQNRWHRRRAWIPVLELMRLG